MNALRGMFFVWFFIHTVFSGPDAEAKMEERFEKCCGLGTAWALEGLGCEKFTGPVSGVPQVEQGLCLEAVDICCVRTYHEQQCKKGKADARAGAACVPATSIKSKRLAGPGDYHRDCCEACKLGILTGSMGQGCAFKKFTFGNPWDPAFLECCHEASPSTTTDFPTDASSPMNETTGAESSTTNMSETPFSPMIPTPPLDDICQLMKGLLCSDICVPTPGSYYCKCRDGFTLLEDGKTCRQDLPTDRCKSSNPCEQQCTDDGVAVTCSCNPGYVLANDARSCVPSSTERRTTVPDSDDFSNVCPVGYRYNAASQVCDDIDECAEGLDSCGTEICYNQPGGYVCSKPVKPITRRPLTTTTPLPLPMNKKCPPGTKYVANRCVDVDECRELEDACSSNEECVNTMGSYICECKVGFRRENLTQACVDINECQTQADSCSHGQRCDNTIGSYTCTRYLSCGTGYTLNAATEICEDDDECLLGTHDCGPGYHCRNTLGSYRCDRNPRVPVPLPRLALTTTSTTSTTTTTTSTTLAPITREQINQTVTQSQVFGCIRGFEQNSDNKCVDIDECQRNPNICGRTMRCMNTIGSYRCVSKVICGSGYTLDPVTGQYCVDVDECANNTHECAPNQTCENRIGGYVCICPSGHVPGPNRDCVDIDECSLYGNICGLNSKCENTIGSYRCICENGFENVGNSPGGSCQDVDECKRTPGLCQHSCYNVWGSFRCGCKPGFRLNADNRSCTDVDECTEFKDNRLCIGICENTPGSYACKCPDGYKLGLSGRTCEDIDECKAVNPVCRDPDEICHNTRGSFRCNRINCPSGYHRDHERKNRCVKTYPCLIDDLPCRRQPSHYSYNFISLVSMLPIAPGRPEDLFKMKGYHSSGSTIQFTMALLEARAPAGVQRATESCFTLRRPAPLQAVLAMTRPIQGPQEIELELTMELYHGPMFAGSAVAKLLIFVSQYEF